MTSKMQNTRCRVQDKSPHPPFAKGGRGGIFKNHESYIMRYSSFISMISIMPLLVLLLTSCGKGEVKQVSQESKIAQEAFGLAETIRNAYIKNDIETLERSSTKDGYKELIGAIKTFDTADLTFTPIWVEIEDSKVSLSVSWKGIWIVRGKTTEERGVAVFLLEGRPLKLAKILRENPFRQ